VAGTPTVVVPGKDVWRGAKAAVCDIKPAQSNIPMFLRPRPVSNAEDEQRTIVNLCGKTETWRENGKKKQSRLRQRSKEDCTKLHRSSTEEPLR
jgi:hypothetical protein